MIYLRCVFIIAYLTILCLYFFSETSGNFKRRAVNKIALAVLFEAYAVSAYLLHSPLFSMRMILPIGLFFAFLGDIFLLWNFVRGGICFSIGNFCIFNNLIKNDTTYWRLFCFTTFFQAFIDVFWQVVSCVHTHLTDCFCDFRYLNLAQDNPSSGK